ncbi:unnamed protein product, partial [Brachionus calyciflorus]
MKQSLNFLGICFLMITLFFMVSKSSALQCYECKDCRANSFGKNYTCSNGFNYCIKIKSYVLSIESITRDCAETCAEGKTSALGLVGAEVSCCNTDLCNY